MHYTSTDNTINYDRDRNKVIGDEGGVIGPLTW